MDSYIATSTLDRFIKEFEFKALENVIKSEPGSFGQNAWKIALEAAKSINRGIKALPKSDVSPIVRCKKCRWAVFTDSGSVCACSYLHPSKDNMLSVTDDFFCAYGEPLRCEEPKHEEVTSNDA